MFCFVVLLTDGRVLAGFTKSILCWNWAGSHTQLSSGSEFPSAQPVSSSRCTEVVLQAWFFWASICKVTVQPFKRGSLGEAWLAIGGCSDLKLESWFLWRNLPSLWLWWQWQQCPSCPRGCPRGCPNFLWVQEQGWYLATVPGMKSSWGDAGSRTHSWLGDWEELFLLGVPAPLQHLNPSFGISRRVDLEGSFCLWHKQNGKESGDCLLLPWPAAFSYIP